MSQYSITFPLHYLKVLLVKPRLRPGINEETEGNVETNGCIKEITQFIHYGYLNQRRPGEDTSPEANTKSPYL